MTRAATRAGFGLIELLVVLAIITTLAALGLLVWPGIRDQDKVKDTATIVAIQLKDAQGRAAKKRSPVGVRFVVVPSLDPSNPAKTDNQWVTELQFVELPDPLIPNPTPLSPSTQNPTADPTAEPRVRFEYTPDATGAITGRKCYVDNLTLAQVSQIEPGCTLVMSAFGSWHRIIAQAGGGLPAAVENPSGSGRYTRELPLEVFPDSAMGGATNQVIYHFAIYLLATPLVGEKPTPLPTEICVDLNLSIGPQQGSAASFDVIFGPDGKLVSANTGQLFLYVRNYTKDPIYTGSGNTLAFKTGTSLVTAFRRSGEQHVVSVRNTGAVGHAQVFWPDMTTGQYPGNQSPALHLYTLARREQNQD